MAGGGRHIKQVPDGACRRESQQGRCTSRLVWQRTRAGGGDGGCGVVVVVVVVVMVVPKLPCDSHGLRLRPSNIPDLT